MFKSPDWYLLHPAAVHFPIALLIVGWVTAVGGRLKPSRAWLPSAASWLLWLGTAAAWAALGLGLLAEKTAPHVPPAWQTLNTHETLAWWTVSVAAGLSLWRWRLGRMGEAWFLLLWLALCALITATGLEGGELVFEHGMGVSRG